MAVYKCSVCGAVFDEEKEGRKLAELFACPICGQPIDRFQKVESAASDFEPLPLASAEELAYDSQYARRDPSVRHMDDIHDIATSGKSLESSMGLLEVKPSWDDVLFLGAQLNPAPLLDDEPVETRTIIGKNAAKPMVLESPIFISHMSFGALSREAKIALAKGAAAARTATCSGEGGILPEERDAAYRYIFEYVPNKYSVMDENLRRADAIEIKIGQGTKPGMGGRLPGAKVTEEIARLRGKSPGEDIQSPSRFKEIKTREELKALVSELRERSGGRPIGVKLAAGRIEADLEFCLAAEPDFVTLDGRGGGTGASPKLLRDSSSVPTIYALTRARRYLDRVQSDVELVITGGLRVSSDFAKALALGADAVAIATAGLVAAGCQQYRVCGSGKCPVGIATQDPDLRARLDVDAAARRVANFLEVSREELMTFARITGRSSVHDLSVADLVTLDRDLVEFSGIPHAGAPYEAPQPDVQDDVTTSAPSASEKRKFVCTICGGVCEGDELPETCPFCGVAGVMEEA